MTQPAEEDHHGWLTLQEASERLDVHPATLRQWADRGRVRIFRTPGGHRRFSAEDIQELLTALSSEVAPELDLLQNAALGRVRREISGGRLAGESWHRLLDPLVRDRYRQLGRELIGLLVRSLSAGPDAEPVLADARRAAREQGHLAAQAALTLVEAVRVFTVFRDMVVESVLQVRAVQDHGRPGRDLVGFYRQVGSFLDEALFAYLDAFSETGR
jgi:excisionase family DNA binding protein